MEAADFSGYATKAGLKCSDGRTIMPDAFKDNDGTKVPLVWQHGHTDSENVLGHAILENREDGVYAHGYFNKTPKGIGAKELVQHGDIVSLSIYASQLVERGKQVFHGAIKEVSLVLSGANPGAKIDFVSLSHADGVVEELDDEAIIYTGLTLEHEDVPSAVVEDESPAEVVVEHAATAPAAEVSLQDVYDTFTEEQKAVVDYLIGTAVETATASTTDATVAQSDIVEEKTEETPAEPINETVLTHQEGTEMTRNVFEQHQDGGAATQVRRTLTHDELTAIVEDAKKTGSFREAFLAHAVEYGIENIDYLFPDARTLASSPEMITRRQEWVSVVLNGTKKSPFSRIKTVSADLTLDEARAKGHVKASLKKEEWFGLTQRVTTPTTIYKKQKLDRDDIIDITDLDVVAWLKAEMRIMLDEEIARAVLVGDGREIDDPDKINETNIRPIAYEDEFYAHKVVIAANVAGDDVIEAILRARPSYRGTGSPTLFLTESLLTDMLLIKDKMGRRMYGSLTELATVLRVSQIVTVPVMESLSTTGGDLIAILVNLNDYVNGADKGGNISMFDDFDIDYNQYKYLMETRLSGALTGFKTALVFVRGAGTLVTPAAPTFVKSTGVVTIPATANVVYSMDGVAKVAGAQTAIAAGTSVEVTVAPASGYYFAHNLDNDWTFTRDA